MWPAIIGAGVSLLGGMMADKPKTKTVSNKDLAGNYTDFKANMDRQNALSESLIDPNSSYNQIMINNLKKNQYENTAFANMLNNRNMAQGGMGGYSGIQNQQRVAGIDKSQQLTEDRIQNMIANNFQVGLGGLQNVSRGYQQYGDTMAQNQLNNVAMQNQIAQAQSQSDFQGILGFGQGLLQYGLNNV